MTVLFLPYPPTANHLFGTDFRTKNRFVSKDYKAWREAAGLVLNTQNPGKHAGNVEVLYEFRRPDNRRRDVANLEKGPTDLLVTHGVIADDSLIDEMTLRWVKDVPWEVRVTVRDSDG